MLQLNRSQLWSAAVIRDQMMTAVICKTRTSVKIRGSFDSKFILQYTINQERSYDVSGPPGVFVSKFDKV